MASRRTRTATGRRRGDPPDLGRRAGFPHDRLTTLGVTTGSCDSVVRSAPARTTITPGSATPARIAPRSRAAIPHHRPWRLLGTTSRHFHPGPRRQQSIGTTSRQFHPHPRRQQSNQWTPIPPTGNRHRILGPQPRITPHIAAELRDLDTHGHGSDRPAPRSNVRSRCGTASSPSPHPANHMLQTLIHPGAEQTAAHQGRGVRRLYRALCEVVVRGPAQPRSR